MSDLEQINQVLLEELEKRDEEISKLQKDINSLLDSPSMGQESSSSALSDKDAMKLVKKNRNLIVKLNKAKGQIVQLEMNLKMEQEKMLKMKEGKKVVGGNLATRHYGAKSTARGAAIKKKDGTTGSSLSDVSPGDGQSLEQSLQEQTKKFEKSLLRINELRESNQKLRLEAKKMKNLLQKELGENVDIDQLLNDGGTEGWRGRQQEVFLLKSRVKQYQGQLVLLKKRLQDANSADDTESELDDSASVAASTVDPKQMQTIRQLSDARRQEITDLQEQLKKAEENREKWKRNTEAAKARCNILEREISSQNMKTSRIIKKTENDDKYIGALKAELDKLRGKLRESNKKLSNTRTIKPGETLSSTLTTLHNQEVDELQRQVADMEHELAQKEETIQSLKQQLRRATEEGVSIQHASLTSSLSTMDQNPKNAAELRITVLELELEKNRDLEQFYHQQLKDYELREQEAGEEIQSLKHKVKGLEHALSKAKVKSPTTESTPTDEQDMQKLADNLYLVMDENNVLKQTIKSLRATKERELKIYKDLLLKQKSHIDTFAETNPRPAVVQGGGESDDSSAQDELQQKNELLTKQLKEMKNRYTAVSIQLQNAQNQLKNLQ